MSGLARALAGDHGVRSGERVERVLSHEGAFVLELRRRGDEVAVREGPFDELVLATPPRQAAELLSDLAGPARDAAERLSGALLPSLCAMAAFAAPLEGAAGGMFVVGDDVLGWAAHDGGKPRRGGAPTYVLHGAAEWSLANYQRPEEQFAKELLAAFGRALGRATALPAPVHLVGHRWGYALADGEPPTSPFVLEPSGLGLCGDALGGGRVEGAFVSGVELADALLSR
jgi:predicted NAD/FAD-dependent oxidoreductase